MATPTPTFLFPSFDAGKQQPKSPKSPKATLENPLLKNQTFLFGSNATAPPLVPEPRNALLTVSTKRHMPQMATPGPPPKASLSFGGGILALASTSPSSQHPATPMTPPPVASPMLLNKVDSISSQHVLAAGEHFWVVAYGYTYREEHQELIELLSSYGRLLQTKSNGNWVAVQYASPLSAEKALCHQPIRLSSSPSSLCGTVRASPILLQSLLSQPPTTLVSQSCANNLSPGLVPNTRAASLQEEDILAHCDAEERSERGPASVCDKLFAWYFGWETSKPHLE